jgi:hypothetical protein
MEDALRHWGDQPLLPASPDGPMAVGPGLAPEDLEAFFLEPSPRRRGAHAPAQGAVRRAPSGLRS